MIKRKVLVVSTLLVSLLIPTPYSQAAPVNSKYLGCSTNDYNCYTAKIDTVIKQSKSIDPVLKSFDEIAKNTNGINGQCNNFGRYIGKELYKKYKALVLNYHNYTCGEPYTYGFMESMGAESKDVSNLVRNKLVPYCAKDKFPDMCAYGIGISQSSSKLNAGEIQKNCEKYFPASAQALTLPYEVRAEGICLLGWVSGKNSVLPSSYYKTIKSAMAICDGSYKDGKLSCLAEATFAYTYVGNPTSEVRIKRVYELKERCKDDTSSMCYRFIGKALDDYFLYSLQLDLKNKTSALEASKLVSSLCVKGSTYCIEGLLNAHVVHRSKEDAKLLCSALEVKYRKICLAKLNP